MISRPPAVATEIGALISANYPLIYILSFEEVRVEDTLKRIADNTDKLLPAPRELWVWTITDGWTQYGRRGDMRDTADPQVALQWVVDRPPGDQALYVLKDFHVFLRPESAGAALVIRKLRDVTSYLSQGSSCLLVLAPVLAIPPELEKVITVVDFPLPSEEDHRQMLDKFRSKYGRTARFDLDPETEAQMMRALLGLTSVEAENVLSRAISGNRRLDRTDLDLIVREKAHIIRKSGVLEFLPLDRGLDQVGGLEAMKLWLQETQAAFEADARSRGVRMPRGVLIIGVPGCGKSLTAKAIAAAWHMPLLRFDIGRVFAMYVGQSEENVRRVMRTAEAVAPCVLWIDELEKGFAGARSGDSDSGVATRVLGSFMTWMQEKEKPVFVAATANDISRLPPETLRKGRFDEVFFVDLPMRAERDDILRVHLLSRSVQPEPVITEQLLDATSGFTGADLESVVEAGLRRAFHAGKRDLQASDLMVAAAETQPLSALMRESIADLRSWARKRARPASARVEEEVAPPQERDLFEIRRLDLGGDA